MSEMTIEQTKTALHNAIPADLTGIKGVSQKIAGQVDLPCENMHFELSVYNLFAVIYAAKIKMNKRTAVGSVLKEYRSDYRDHLGSWFGGRIDVKHEFYIRRRFYEKLINKYPKPKFFVTQSAGLIIDMLTEERLPSEEIRGKLSKLAPAAWMILKRYLLMWGRAVSGLQDD